MTLAELDEEIAEATSRLQQIRHEFGAYEESMKAVREADEQRAKDLDDWAKRLKAEERKLGEDRRNLKAEREQFYKTKALQ